MCRRTQKEGEGPSTCGWFGLGSVVPTVTVEIHPGAHAPVQPNPNTAPRQHRETQTNACVGAETTKYPRQSERAPRVLRRHPGTHSHTPLRPNLGAGLSAHHRSVPSHPNPRARPSLPASPGTFPCVSSCKKQKSAKVSSYRSVNPPGLPCLRTGGRKKSNTIMRGK